MSHNFHMCILHTVLEITAGQRTMSGLMAGLTFQTLVLPVMLIGHFWIRTFSCRLMLYDAVM